MEGSVNIATPFAEAGLDIEAGAELFGLLGLTTDVLLVPQYMNKISQLSDFIGGDPEGMHRLKIAASRNLSPHIDMIDHLSSYVLLVNERKIVHDKFEELNRQISFYE